MGNAFGGKIRRTTVPFGAFHDTAQTFFSTQAVEKGGNVQTGTFAVIFFSVEPPLLSDLQWKSTQKHSNSEKKQGEKKRY